MEIYYLMYVHIHAGSPAPSGCDSSLTITPPVLAISEGEPRRLTCSTSTSTCEDVINVYIFNPNTEVSITQSNLFDDIVHFTSNHTSCLYSLDISWTNNEKLRRNLSSIQCVFSYSTTTNPCTTDVVTVSFLGKL